MKKLALLTLLLAIVGCGKPKVVPVQPAPAAVKTGHAVGDTLYVIKRFSVTTADRLYGFPLGRKVTLLAIEADDYLVSDGAQRARASRDSFTNDASAAARLASQVESQLAQVQGERQPAASSTLPPSPEAVERHQRNMAVLRNEIEILNHQIELESGQLTGINHQRTGKPGETYSSNGERTLSGGGSQARSYSLQEKVRKLTARRDALRKQLQQLQQTGP